MNPADQLERRYDNNSDISLETDQKNLWNIGDPSNQNESNDIPSGLSERDFQKYNRLLHKLKFGKFINDVVPTTIASVPTAVKTTAEVTTEKMNDGEVQTTPTTLLFNQPATSREEIFPGEITDVDEDYDIIILDKTQQLQPILMPSGAGFFHGFVNFVRWLITASAIVEDEDYVDE